MDIRNQESEKSHEPILRKKKHKGHFDFGQIRISNKKQDPILLSINGTISYTKSQKMSE